MLDNYYFEALKDELLQLYGEYDNCYDSLNQNVTVNCTKKRWFSGSDELLCIYEPSLIDRLRCKWCLKGSFREKKPRSKIYHSISFDDKDNIIKIDFYDNESYDFQSEHKEIFAVYNAAKTIYLVFDESDKEKNPILREIYLMKYNDIHQLTEYVHIPSRALCRDLTGEIHKYNGNHLIESVKYSTWYSEFLKYEYFYGDDGYLSCYKYYDINKKRTAYLYFKCFNKRY